MLLLGLVQNVTNVYNLTLSSSNSNSNEDSTRGNSSNSRDSEAAQQLLESFSRETIEVLRAVLGIASIEENDCSFSVAVAVTVVTPHCKVLFSQIVCKVAWLLLQFGKVLSKLDLATKAGSHCIMTMLPSMVSITQIGSSALQLMTNIVGDSSMGYYYSRVLYWHACIHLLQLLRCIAFNQQLSSSPSSSSNADPNLAAALHSSPSSSSPHQQQLQQQVYLWSLQKRVFGYLQSTAPSTHDIFHEVHRSEDYTQTLLSSQEDSSLMQLLLSMMETSRSTMMMMTAPHGSSSSSSSSSVVTTSFKLRFLLTGMSSVFKGYSVLLSRSTCNYRDPLSQDALR